MIGQLLYWTVKGIETPKIRKKIINKFLGIFADIILAYTVLVDDNS
jgi:hypothetical protein